MVDLDTLQSVDWVTEFGHFHACWQPNAVFFINFPNFPFGPSAGNGCAGVQVWNMGRSQDVIFYKDCGQIQNVGWEQQEEAEPFLTVHLPEGAPGVWQPLAGCTHLHFHQCCTCLFLCVFSSSIWYVVFWFHVPWASHMFIHSGCSPFAPLLLLGVIWGENRVCWRVCEKAEPILLHLYAEDDFQSSKACHHWSDSPALFLCKTGSYLLSPWEKGGTERGEFGVSVLVLKAEAGFLSEADVTMFIPWVEPTVS